VVTRHIWLVFTLTAQPWCNYHNIAIEALDSCEPPFPGSGEGRLQSAERPFASMSWRLPHGDAGCIAYWMGVRSDSGVSTHSLGSTRRSNLEHPPFGLLAMPKEYLMLESDAGRSRTALAPVPAARDTSPRSLLGEP